MKVFLDTSILVSALLAEHSDHPRSLPLLLRVHAGKDDGVISAHSLAETYAILTKLPPPFRHSPEQALLSIEENILKFFKLSALTATEYPELIRDSAPARIFGGTIYDALILKCAEKENVSKIFTLNIKHFQLIASPAIARILSVP